MGTVLSGRELVDMAMARSYAQEFTLWRVVGVCLENDPDR